MRGWTQAMMARRSGLTRSLVSHLENGTRVPTSGQRTALVKALQLPGDILGQAPSGTRHGGWPDWQQTALWARFLPRPRRYQHDRERPNWMRLRAAQKEYPELYQRVYRACLARHGRRLLAELIHYGSCGSGLEALTWLRLLEAVTLSYVSPARLGWARLPVLEQPSGHVIGDRLWPAFVIEKPFLCALLPQVRLKPWDDNSYRLDFLACVRLDHRLVWADVEVDGIGHDSRGDKKRTASLRLPRVSLTDEDVCAPNFMERLIWKLQVILGS